ncbi:MAG TPA: hypothetical protein VM425_13465 [Myxococcota bacterium]|nr:hypothetical protein [Myxococcota bacterium]
MRGTRTIIAIIAGLSLAACAGQRAASNATVTHAPKADTQTAAVKLPRVIIKNFSVSGISKDEASGIAGKFCVDVSKSKKINLVCAEDLKNLFEHQEDMIKFGACNEQDCLAKMSAMLKADYIVQGSISKVGETFVFNVNLVEGAGGTVKTRISENVASGKVEDLLMAADSLAAKLIAEF